MMHVYEIASGWIGCSYERVYVIAESDDEAIRLATEKFRVERKPEKLTHVRIQTKMPCVAGNASLPSDEGMEFDYG